MDNKYRSREVNVVPGQLVPKIQSTVTECSVIVSSGVSEVKLTPNQ